MEGQTGWPGCLASSKTYFNKCSYYFVGPLPHSHRPTPIRVDPGLTKGGGAQSEDEAPTCERRRREAPNGGVWGPSPQKI